MQRTRVLFVCTHNSARSIMAEVLLRSNAGDRFEVHSAGTEPGEVRALTLQVLDQAGLPTADLRSKSVSEFAGQPFDYVITVCDSARQTCPTFPGGGGRLHWAIEDPSAETGSERERLDAFRGAFAAVSQEVGDFIAISRTAAN